MVSDVALEKVMQRAGGSSPRGESTPSYFKTADAFADVRAADASMMALGALAAAATVGGCRESGASRRRGFLDGGRQHGVKVLQVVRAAHALPTEGRGREATRRRPLD